jgi:hypothetical protein
MAIKLSGSVSRKVPIPGLEYSSQSFGASLEVEINSADPAEVQAQLAQLYSSLNQGIDEQVSAASQLPSPARSNAVSSTIATRSQPVQQSRAAAVPAANGYTNGRNRVAASSNGNGNGRKITCTEAQAKCIYAICKAQGIEMADVLADYNVADVHDLHVKDASRLIDDLKSRQANGAGH